MWKVVFKEKSVWNKFCGGTRYAKKNWFKINFIVNFQIATIITMPKTILVIIIITVIIIV